MKNASFCGWKTEKIEALMNAVNHVTDASYLWVTDEKGHVSWCSGKTKALFGLDGQVYPDFERMIGDYVHPHDRQEYMEGIEKRLRGEGPDWDLCVRIKDTAGKYAMFSFHTELIRNAVGEPEYLIVVIRNENILPDIDARTDLYSAARYQKDLKNVIAAGEKFSLLQIQIEGFKTFYLLYGAIFADRLLREISLRFIYMTDADTAAYRMDGEEFTFLLKNAGRQELVAFERRVRRVLKEEIALDGKTIPLKMAAGAILLEDYQGDASEFCGQVTYALKHSRHQHKGELIIFNDEVQTSAGEDLALVKVIHQSIGNDCEGFYVVYQPIVDSATGTIVGAESLVRWNQKPYGTVSPSKFIEWMETDPSMYELGNFVLRTALTETRRILDRKPDFFVNVNISVRQLERPEFREDVLEILRQTGFPAKSLCLELTERCRDYPMNLLLQDVEFFQSHGIHVAMDDYGTGSASSNIVMSVPMDEIKIDMSFISEIMDKPKYQAMVHSIVDFANQSDMKTCLEGVETEELQNYLRSFGATWFQGYYYAKPLVIDSLEELLSRSVA